MEFTAEDARALAETLNGAFGPWIDLARDALFGPPAQRLYVLQIGAIVLAMCLFFAIRADRWAVRTIETADEVIFEKFMGRTPTKQDSFEKQQSDIRSRAWPFYGVAATSLGITLLAGVVVPTLLLFATTIRYTWFSPTGSHLLDEHHLPVSDPTAHQAIMFAVDQTLRGGVFDFLEVFSLALSRLHNNPENWPFSIGVFGHHVFVEAFLFSGLILFARSCLKVPPLVSKALEEHRKNHERAKAKA